MGARILVVEDDRAIAQSVTRLLARDEYYVIVEGTVAHALQRIEDDPSFDIVLLNVMLPDSSGFICCRKLRERGWRKPVIMLTGKAATTDKVAGLEAGADDYITKPFEPGELLARVRAQLRRSREYATPDTDSRRIPIAPNFHVDLRLHDAVLNGEPAHLTDREYELLLLLARNLDTALDKNWLFQEIWGNTPESGIKALPVYIRRLRTKIQDDSENPRYLQTVRGFGYKLTTEQSTQEDIPNN